MTRDEARRVIIAACFQDAAGKTNYIENAIASIETAARVGGLRRARAIAVDRDTTSRPGAPDWQRDEHFRLARERITEAIDAHIAALERGKGE